MLHLKAVGCVSLWPFFCNQSLYIHCNQQMDATHLGLLTCCGKCREWLKQGKRQSRQNKSLYTRKSKLLSTHTSCCNGVKGIWIGTISLTKCDTFSTISIIYHKLFYQLCVSLVMNFSTAQKLHIGHVYYSLYEMLLTDKYMWGTEQSCWGNTQTC